MQAEKAGSSYRGDRDLLDYCTFSVEAANSIWRTSRCNVLRR